MPNQKYRYRVKAKIELLYSDDMVTRTAKQAENEVLKDIKHFYLSDKLCLKDKKAEILGVENLGPCSEDFYETGKC